MNACSGSVRTQLAELRFNFKIDENQHAFVEITAMQSIGPTGRGVI
jgi:hypothetical protein